MNNRLLRFTKFSKVFFGISLSIIFIGIIFNFIFGTQLDIQFRGGSYIRYSYVGDVDQKDLTDLIQDNTKENITVSYSTDMLSNTKNKQAYTVRVEFAGNKAITTEQQQGLTKALQKAYPDASFKVQESSAIQSTMGFKFLMKCLAAVAIACLLMVLYVTIRFRRIGGLSAGVMALVALFHDVAMIYFMYVIFQMPIDSNFIAVVLMILGYSLNNTIVAYDRIRENRKVLGGRTELSTLTNLSLTQVFRRSILTTVTTVMAVGCVYAVGIIFNLDSIVRFALPTMVGLISGCYSSLAIAPSLWVVWENHKKSKDKKAA